MQIYVIKISAVRLVTGDCFGAPNLSVSADSVDSR
jgi:hypothetical protein